MNVFYVDCSISAMSKSMKCPVDISLRDMIKCRLPDDDVSHKMEKELLKKWGFSENFINSLCEISNQKQQVICDNVNAEFAENAIVTSSEATVTTNCAMENDHFKSSAEIKIPILNDRIRELYEKATACYRSGQFQDGLVHINCALDSNEFDDDKIPLITFKARLLNAMEDYVGTLKAIQEACCGLRSGHLALEGAQALEKLNLLLTAEEMLKTALQIRSKEMDTFVWTQTVQELFQGVRVRRIYEPLIKDAPIKISLSNTGRAVYTKRSITKGETVFSELPEFLEPSLSWQSGTACSQCGSTLLKPDDVVAKDKRTPSDVKKAVKKCWPTRATTPCPGCNRVVYCSESCRQDAWLSYHQDICPSCPNSRSTVLYDVRDSFRDVTVANGFSWQGWWNAEFSPLLLARVWATLLMQAKLRAGSQNTSNDDDLLMSVFSTVKKYWINSETGVCKHVPRMFDLARNIFKRSKFLGYEITEAEFDQMYQRISTNYISFHDVRSPIQECLDRAKSNQKLYKKIVKCLQEPVQKVELHGLFPLVSCINHCCLPNAEILSGVVDGRPGIVVTAKRDIPEMGEVTIAYVDPQVPRSERRDMMFRRYKFWCQCLRCEFEGDDPETCTQCRNHPRNYSDNRPSEHNKGDCGCLQNCSAVQGASVKQSSTGSLQFSQFKRDEVSDNHSNCKRENQKNRIEVNHNDDIKTKMGNQQQDNNLCVSVTDMCGSDCQDNYNVDNGPNHIPFRKDLPTESSAKAPSGQAEETRAQPENVTNLESVSVTDDKTNLESVSVTDDKTNLESVSVTDGTMNSKSGLRFEREALTKYPHCSRCGRAWYCSEKCQKEAWKAGHKQICGKY